MACASSRHQNVFANYQFRHKKRADADALDVCRKIRVLISTFSHLTHLFFILQVVYGADLVIEISDVGKHQDGSYRLFYDPPYGSPPPNTTIASKDIGDSIQFSKALPGTNYNFWLFYTNETHKDWLTWRVQITTGTSRPLIFDIYSRRTSVCNILS